jgi:hypothetical protein
MDKINRKDFFKRAALLGVTAASLPAFIESCGGNSKKNSPANNDPCSDTSGLTADQLQTRKTFQYTGHSPHNDKYCSICNFFIKPQGNAHCGTCQVVKGPINPDGYCNSFIKKQSL